MSLTSQEWQYKMSTPAASFSLSAAPPCSASSAQPETELWPLPAPAASACAQLQCVLPLLAAPAQISSTCAVMRTPVSQCLLLSAGCIMMCRQLQSSVVVNQSCSINDVMSESFVKLPALVIAAAFSTIPFHAGSPHWDASDTSQHCH